MAESITYGSYTFPSPTPLVGHGVEPISINGKVDHFADSIEVIGNLTGENLSGLHLQKMKMVSGLMSEFETLTITNDAENKTFTSSKPQNISFEETDLTTFLPYSVSFVSHSSGTFSEFFGISEPQDRWEFKEENGRITNATHTVSAKGVKVDSSSSLDNARLFVTGRTSSGFLNLSLFQTGDNAFLISRNEEINKSSNLYTITEQYKYSTSEDLVTDSGIFNCNTQISFEKDQGLNVRVAASVQGSMTGSVDQKGLIHTGVFTADQAAEIAVNAVAASVSDYESGLYTFIDRGPSSSSFNVDTGSNKVDFTYDFTDANSLDQEGNILHKRSASVSANKDTSVIKVSINGDFTYNTMFDAFATGDPATGERFKEVDAYYSGVEANSGFFNLAVENFKYFREDATGYQISGDYLNPTPLSRQISKIPADSRIAYSLEFDNNVDLSSGTLTGLKVNIIDKKPLLKSGIVPSLAGFAKQIVSERTAGEYQVTATCEAETGNLQTLKDVVSGHMTGIYTFSESSSVNDNTISYNTSRYY